MGAKIAIGPFPGRCRGVLAAHLPLGVASLIRICDASRDASERPGKGPIAILAPRVTYRTQRISGDASEIYRQKFGTVKVALGHASCISAARRISAVSE